MKIEISESDARTLFYELESMVKIYQDAIAKNDFSILHDLPKEDIDIYIRELLSIQKRLYDKLNWFLKV